MNELGLTKNQVKNIIKVAKHKDLEYRRGLQGLIYEAEAKLLSVTNGFFAYSWSLQDYSGDLPEKDMLIHYTKLNAWQVNAKAKDILSFGELLETMAEPYTIPKVSIIIKDGIKEPKDGETIIHLPVMNTVCDIAEGKKVVFTTKEINGANGYFGKTVNTLYPQTIIIMGMRG